MKNLISLSLLLLILLSSCGKDDKDLTMEIIGTFELESFEILSDCEDPEIVAQVVQATPGGCITLFGDMFCRKVQFLADGTVILTETDGEDEYSSTLNYSIDANGDGSVHFDAVNDEDIPFTFDGDRLTTMGQEDGCTTIELYKKV